MSENRYKSLPQIRSQLEQLNTVFNRTGDFLTIPLNNKEQVFELGNHHCATNNLEIYQ